jgi:hypothetical protein
MAVPSYTQSFSTFASGTLEARRKNVIDQVFLSTEFLAWASAHRTAQMGGKKVFNNAEYGKDTSLTRGLGRGGKVPLTYDEIITEFWYDWTTYAAGLVKYRDDELENSGKFAVFNLFEKRLANVIKTFREGMEQDLVEAGTSTVKNGLDKFIGLGYLVEDADTSAADSTQVAGTNTIGNLNRATYPWFSNWGRNMTGKDVSTHLTWYMREAVDNVVTYTGVQPEAILTHYVTRNFYEDEVGETLRTMTVKLGDIGYKVVEWKGIPFITSPYASQTRMYFMGVDTYEMIYEPRMWFKSTPDKQPTQQPFDFARQVVAKGQSTIKKPRGTSVLYNINN